MRQLTRSRISPWTIIAFILFFFALCCINLRCEAQTTTISATVVDQASTVWANGTWKLDFVPNPNYPSNNVNWNGSPFPTSLWTLNGNLDSSGTFSQSGVKSNNFITPVGSTYTLTICPNATSACSVITSLTIQGTTLNLSSTITNSTPAPNVKPLPLARAYNDAEVVVNPTLVGYFYQNVTTKSPRYWDGSTWQPFINGVVSFHSGNLPPLFTTSIGSDPTNPNLSFSLATVAPDRVFGNCTGSTTTPTFCALVAAMIPPLPYVPVATNFFYQTVDLNGTAQTQRAALNFSSFFTSADSASPSRTTINAANSGVTAGTYTNPDSVTVDAFGRTTAIHQGPAAATASLAPNGWEISTTGHIHEWGHVTLVNDGCSPSCTSVTFPLPFPHVAASVTLADDFASATSRIMSVVTLNTTQFTANSDGSGDGAYWQADGW